MNIFTIFSPFLSYSFSSHPYFFSFSLCGDIQYKIRIIDTIKKIPDDVDLRKITLSKNKIKKQVKMDLFKGLKLHLKLMVSYAAIRVLVCVCESE